MKYISAAIGLGAILVAALAAPGEQWNQEWKLKPSRTTDRVHFRIERSKWRNNWSTSRDVPLSRFRGLSPETLARNGRVRFEYVHDAGRLICEGSLWSGSGSGSFTFTIDSGFVAELKHLGYEEPDGDQIISILMTDVDLPFAHGVRKRVPDATTRQLIELSIHGVTLDYLREAEEAGYRNLGAKDFVEMRIHGVSTAFLRDLKASGYDLAPREAVELRIHGVTSEFVRDLKQAGYDLPAKQITELRIHGVNSAYLQELRRYGLQPEARGLVELRIHGVSPEFLKELKDAGYSGLSNKEITELRIHGVQPDFIRDAKSLGYSFTTKELVELRIHGVSGSYLKKLRDTGFKNLTASQIAKLKIHGID